MKLKRILQIDVLVFSDNTFDNNYFQCEILTFNLGNVGFKLGMVSFNIWYKKLISNKDPFDD